MRHLPQVFACYLFTTNNFSHLYKSSTMCEFKFFVGRVDRWGDSMQALWGSLGICPPIGHIVFPATWQKNYILSDASRFEEMSKNCITVWPIS